MTAICWFRRILRLDDHPALVAAAAEGAVIPLVILDPDEARDHPASAMRQALALPELAAALQRQGSRLILRRGKPADVLKGLIRELGTTHVHTTRGFPFATDAGLAQAMRPAGARLILHPNGDLIERGRLTTAAGTGYKVFTPFWRALRGLDIAAPLAPPALQGPKDWPDSEPADWPEARDAMDRGWQVLTDTIKAGEDRALARLDAFLEGPATTYAEHRDQPWREAACSGLSDALATGEISARRVWHHALIARAEGKQGVEDFLRELGWREFARDLLHADPDMAHRCWRQEWQDFPWRNDSEAAERWRRGQTGVPIIDAGMRQLYATGRMHNRIRMIAASYLTKHLLTDWRIGQDWFARTLTDWDPAANAMNWQWVAGCGPDAAPYFRIFNPDTQAKKFDARGRYQQEWLDAAATGAQSFARAAPRSWRIDLQARAIPQMSLAVGRARAMTAYQDFRDRRST